jgi:protocatechuate 3,4-dioxygenase alpha subunit
VPDAFLEVWQADAQGKLAAGDAPGGGGPDGFGRIPTGPDGAFRFGTVVPGPLPGPDGRRQAPHLEVSVFMRGLLQRLVTRIYFPGEPANDGDPVLALLEAGRRGTLVARASEAHPASRHWDVVLQGDGETVFFDC